MRQVELKLKYEELKKEGKLKQYIAKKRKKQASKDKRLLPRRRTLLDNETDAAP